MEYYHNLVTDKSWELLKQLQRDYKFILIGGWAVFLWTKSLKSKDIDIVVDYSELEKLRRNFEISKNERLKKYEVKKEEIDIDIYVHHYSDPGLAAETIEDYGVLHEGFTVPRPEILLILKQKAYSDRQGTPKGEKDRIDIIGLLTLENFEFSFYKSVLEKYAQQAFGAELKNLLNALKEVKELSLDRHKFSKLKKKVLGKL